MIVVTDYENEVEGIRHGKAWCVSSKQKATHLWQKVWLKIDGIGLDQITLVKIKAHSSRKAAVLDPNIRINEWQGNKEADKRAKKGALLRTSILMSRV